MIIRRRVDESKDRVRVKRRRVDLRDEEMEKRRRG